MRAMSHLCFEPVVAILVSLVPSTAVNRASRGAVASSERSSYAEPLATLASLGDHALTSRPASASATPSQ